MQQVMVPASSQQSRKFIALAALAMVVILLTAIVVLALRGPLGRQAVLKELADESQSRVEAGAFHGTYVPRPGCVLEQITLQHNPEIRVATPSFGLDFNDRDDKKPHQQEHACISISGGRVRLIQ
jgi:hypothetical protein